MYMVAQGKENPGAYQKDQDLNSLSHKMLLNTSNYMTCVLACLWINHSDKEV